MKWFRDPFTGLQFCKYIDQGRKVEGVEEVLAPFSFLIVTGIGYAQGTPIRYGLIESKDLVQYLSNMQHKHSTPAWVVSCYPASNWSMAEHYYAKVCAIEQARARGEAVKPTVKSVDNTMVPRTPQGRRGYGNRVAI